MGFITKDRLIQLPSIRPIKPGIWIHGRAMPFYKIFTIFRHRNKLSVILDDILPFQGGNFEPLIIGPILGTGDMDIITHNFTASSFYT